MADGTPFIYDYQMRGFFEKACGILKKIPHTVSSGIKANKKLIDNYVFINERQIPIDMHGGRMGVCQRPLRASTMQGERIALAMSETVPEGSTILNGLIMVNLRDSGSGETVRRGASVTRS